MKTSESTIKLREEIAKTSYSSLLSLKSKLEKAEYRVVLKTDFILFQDQTNIYKEKDMWVEGYLIDGTFYVKSSFYKGNANVIERYNG